MVSTKALGAVFAAFSIGVGIFLSGNFWWGVLATLIISAFVIYKSLRQKDFSPWLFITLFVLIALLGVWRGQLVSPVRTSEADWFVDQKTEVIGIVASDPDRRMDSIHYVVEVESIEGISLEKEVLALVSLTRYPEYGVGERLTFSGKLQFPKDFETDAVRPPFPYVKYLAKDGIGYVVRRPIVESREESGKHSILRMLSVWKQSILEKGHVLFREPEGGLIAGMLLGERHALAKDILDDMRVAGLVHIIVVSGYNMTIVAEWASRLFRFLPFVARSGIGFLIVWVYAGMVAGGAPVTRAAIMTSLALLARTTKNSVLALRLLYISGLAMVIHNPRIVLDDASFHLSFLATFGLIILSPRVSALIHAPKDKTDTLPWWKELFSATVSAQLMVLPYILFFSGQLSPYALFANLLALPMVPVTMGFSTLALLVSTIFPWLGEVLGVLSSIPAWWVLRVGAWSAQLPGAGMLFPIPLWGALLLYALGTVLFLRWQRNGVDVSKEKPNNNERKEGDTRAIPAEDMKTFSERVSKEDKCTCPNE